MAPRVCFDSKPDTQDCRFSTTGRTQTSHVSRTCPEIPARAHPVITDRLSHGELHFLSFNGFFFFPRILNAGQSKRSTNRSFLSRWGRLAGTYSSCGRGGWVTASPGGAPGRLGPQATELRRDGGGARALPPVLHVGSLFFFPFSISARGKSHIFPVVFFFTKRKKEKEKE